MNKIKKYLKEHLKEFLIVGFLCLGLLTLVVGKNNFVQFSLTCISWSVALFLIARLREQKGVEEILAFDKEAQEIMEDIEINGKNSEYYEVFDEINYNVNRLNRIKQLRRQNRFSKIFAIILLITSILCMI